MKCTYCGGTEFFEGPSGGMSTNILCANHDCRHWFNHDPTMSALEDLHRAEPTKEERQEEEAHRQAIKDHPMKCYLEGKSIFEKGRSAKDCIESGAGWHSCNGEDFYRLAGFIDSFTATKDDMK